MTESDWKRFRKMVPDLRERYLEKINFNLRRSLTDKEKTPTEAFWDTEEIIRKESDILRSCFDGHSRSKLSWFMSLMLWHGILELDDLKDFSPDLREHLEQRYEFELARRNNSR